MSAGASAGGSVVGLGVRVVVVVLLAVSLLVADGVAAQEPVQDGEIVGLSLTSNAAGQLTVSWETPTPAPRDYRLMWARDTLDFLSWRDANEADCGNEYPPGTATSLTLTGLSPGETYKVKLRARYGPGNGRATIWSGPFTATATATVAQQDEVVQQDEIVQQRSDDGSLQGDEPTESIESAEIVEVIDSEPQIALQTTVPAVDEPADTSTTATLTIGGDPTTGGLHHVGDTDWFKVTLAASTVYQFSVYDKDFEDGGTAQATEIKAIYNSEGTKLDDSAANRPVSRLGAGTQYYRVGNPYKPRKRAALSTFFLGAGVYYVEVGVHANFDSNPHAFFDSEGNPRSYTVAVVTDDYTNSNPGTIAVGGSATGTSFQRHTNRDETDLFSVTGLQPGGKYVFVLYAHPTWTGQQASSLSISDLFHGSVNIATTRNEVMGHVNKRWIRKAVHVASSYTAGSTANVTVQFNDSPGVDYTLYLWDASGASYDEDDHGEDFGETDKTALFTPGHLNSQTAGQTVDGTIGEAGDSDWYRSWIDFRSDYTVTVTQQAANGCLRVKLMNAWTGPGAWGAYVRAPSRGNRVFSNAATIVVNHSGDRYFSASRVGFHYIVVEGGPTYVHNTTNAERCDKPNNLSDYTVANRNTEYQVTIDGPDN